MLNYKINITLIENDCNLFMLFNCDLIKRNNTKNKNMLKILHKQLLFLISIKQKKKTLTLCTKRFYTFLTFYMLFCLAVHSGIRTVANFKHFSLVLLIKLTYRVYRVNFIIILFITKVSKKKKNYIMQSHFTVLNITLLFY